MQSNVPPQRPKIFESAYLYTDEICRLYTLYHEGANLTIPYVSLIKYRSMLKNSNESYPLLLPFGSNYYLFSVKIGNDFVNTIVTSAYSDRDISPNYIGLMTYVAVEIVRRGYYERDYFMRRFRSHYDKIRKNIPANYGVYVNGVFADIDYPIMRELLGMILNDYNIPSRNSSCFGCPLISVCPNNKPIIHQTTIISTSTTGNSLGEHMFKSLLNMDVYLSLKSAGVDPLIFLTLFFFRSNFQRIKAYMPSHVNYMGVHNNAAVAIRNIINDANYLLLSLADGEVYTSFLSLKEKYPDISVFLEGKNVTDQMLYRDIALKHMKGEFVCPEIEKYLSSKYSENEVSLFYLAFTDFINMLYYPHYNGHSKYYFTNWFYFMNKMSNLFLIKKVMDSNLYREGLIEVDIKNARILPTNKAFDIMRRFCGGGEL